MTIEADYTRWADSYDADANATRDLDRSAVAEVLGKRRFALTIEAACGTGKNTALLADISASVQALDFSPGMLAKARVNVRQAHVRFHQADLTDPWPCGSAVADLVSCNLVLEHIQHIGPVFREAARTLKPGGMFFISELHPARQYLGSQARFVDKAGATTLIQAYVHHTSDFVRAALSTGFVLERLDEWWHAEEDTQKAPRLFTLLLRKQTQ